MNHQLAGLAALVALASPGERVPPDLEFAYVAVTDGIVGGVIGPTPYVRLAAGFDRVERGFRAWRRKGQPGSDEVWIAKLQPEEFRALLEVAVATGVADLPLEDPPGCLDVYERARQIRLDYGDVHWANGAPDGCVHLPSKVVPSEAERQKFDDAVARLEQAVDALPLRRGSGFEMDRLPHFQERHASETYRRILQHVLADPLRHRLDLERVEAWNDRASFCWRGRHDESQSGDVHFVIDRKGAVVRAPSPNDRSSSSPPFVPIETGMALAEMLDRLGSPDLRDELEDGSLVLTYFVPGMGWKRPAPARLRFEDGRLCAP